MPGLKLIPLTIAAFIKILAKCIATNAADFVACSYSIPNLLEAFPVRMTDRMHERIYHQQIVDLLEAIDMVRSVYVGIGILGSGFLAWCMIKEGVVTLGDLKVTSFNLGFFFSITLVILFVYV